jgi:hypothetical protein
LAQLQDFVELQAQPLPQAQVDEPQLAQVQAVVSFMSFVMVLSSRMSGVV